MRERGAELCRALRQAFTGDAVRSYAGLVEAVVRRYFARWDAGGEVKAYVQCKDLAFDVACAILLGMQLDVRGPPACTPPARPVLLSARPEERVERGAIADQGNKLTPRRCALCCGT